MLCIVFRAKVAKNTENFAYLCKKNEQEYMKTVILDGFVANPGDLTWSEWSALGDFVVYERTESEQVVARAANAEVVLTNKTVLTQEIIESLPKLRYIGVLATGYNVVDLDAARRHGVVVTNIPAYSTASVAQLVMAHLLNIANGVADYAQAVTDGAWQRSTDFCFYRQPQMELCGKTMGIVGVGNIGRAVARVASALGMRVVAFSSKKSSELSESGIEKAESLETLFRESDVVSLHCPLTNETHHIINRHSLSWMKPTAILINTGRGPLVDEEALAEALREDRLYAAGLDVLTQEPPRQGSPLIGAPRCFITPHIAWATPEARQRLLSIALQNVQAFLDGNPQNVVSNK